MSEVEYAYLENHTGRELKWQWDGEEKHIAPGETALFPDYLARHAAKWYPPEIDPESGVLTPQVTVTRYEGDIRTLAAPSAPRVFQMPESLRDEGVTVDYATAEELATAIQGVLEQRLKAAGKATPVPEVIVPAGGIEPPSRRRM